MGPLEFWEQCINDTPIDKIPLLIFTRNHQPIYCLTYEKYYNIIFTKRIKNIKYNDLIIFLLDDLLTIKYKTIEKKLKGVLNGKTIK